MDESVNLFLHNSLVISTRLYNFINDTLVAESTVKLLYAFCAVF